jgi:hypothetical protein
MSDFTIEELKNVISSFSPTQCDFLSENCIVALEKNKHATGCILRVTGEITTEFTLVWSKVFNRSGYRETKKITEKAAEAISFFLSSRLTEYSVIEEAVIGTGIDHETPTNTLKERVKQKKEQTTPSDTSGLPVYVSVVEFSTPKASFGKK